MPLHTPICTPTTTYFASSIRGDRSAKPVRSWLSEWARTIRVGGRLRSGFPPHRVIGVAEVDPLADARMAGAEDLVEQARAGMAEVLPLQLDERHRGRMVGVGQLEGEAIGLVLLVSAIGQGDRAQEERRHLHQQEHQ